MLIRARDIYADRGYVLASHLAMSMRRRKKTSRGLFAEGWKTGAWKDRGQCHKTSRALLHGRIAEVFVFCRPSSGMNSRNDLSAPRKDFGRIRGGSRALQGSSISYLGSAPDLVPAKI